MPHDWWCMRWCHAPEVARRLGDRLVPLFADYTEAQPKPRGDGHADVVAFVAYPRAIGAG